MKKIWQKIVTAFKSIPLFFKKITRLPKSKRLTYEILIALAFLIVLIVVIYALGIYKYHWSRYGRKTIVKIVPYPAAFVGSSWITLAKFDQQKNFIEHFYIKTGAPLPLESELDKQVIDRLIEQRLIEKEAKKQRVLVSQKEIEDEYKKIVEENQGEENVKKMLKDLYDMSLKNFKKLIAEKLILEKFKNEILVSAHVYHILIKVPEGASEGDLKYLGDRTWEVLNQINAGGNFEELAKKFSQDEASKDKGGDLGWIFRGGIISGKPMSKDFEKAVFSLDVGQISPGPVLTEFGWHIFKVTDKKGKLEKSYNDWVKEIKGKTWIKKFVGE